MIDVVCKCVVVKKVFVVILLLGSGVLLNLVGGKL